MNIVVTGPINSGTSLVAGTLRCLGVFMGDRFHGGPAKHEDALFSAIEFSPDMVGTIQQRNERFPVWGFKWPIARGWLESIYPYLREPKFIYCHRDPYRRMADNPEKYGGVRHFAEYLAESSFLGRFFLKRSVDFLIIDFEMSLADRIKILIDFLGLNPSAEQLEKALEFHDKERGYHAID